MKLTLLLISLAFLTSCTGTSVMIPEEVLPQATKLNTYLKDVALYEATVRSMGFEKTFDDLTTAYSIYSGSLQWTSCATDKGADCTPPGFYVVMKDDAIIWFEEAAGSLTCTSIESIGNTEVIDYIRDSQCTQEVGAAATKDLGSGFVLSQTDDETALSYSGKVVKTWSHTPPEKIPYVWDEACKIIFDGFENLTPEEQSTGKQSVWDKLSMQEKRECIKETYAKEIMVQGVSERFFEIRQLHYENWTSWVYDTSSGNMHLFANDEKTGNIIESVSVTPSGIVFRTARSHGDAPPIQVTFDLGFTSVISTEDLPIR